MVSLYKKKSLIFVLLFLFFNFLNVIRANLYAQSNNLNNNSIENPQNFRKEIQSEYILGPGDQIFIDFLGLNIFTDNYNIDPDGRIFLPELDRIKAEGKTITELKNLTNMEWTINYLGEKIQTVKQITIDNIKQHYPDAQIVNEDEI